MHIETVSNWYINRKQTKLIQHFLFIPLIFSLPPPILVFLFFHSFSRSFLVYFGCYIYNFFSFFFHTGQLNSWKNNISTFSCSSNLRRCCRFYYRSFVSFCHLAVNQPFVEWFVLEFFRCWIAGNVNESKR